MKLELYHREECPYSAKVRNYIASHKLREKVIYHDVDEEQKSEKELETLTGDDQVPCLVVDGRPILESDDIIEWLSDHESELSSGS